MRGYLYGLRLLEVRCPGADPGCVVNGNTARDNTHWGILVDESSGYTVTRNVAASNGTTAFFEAFHAGGIALGNGVDGTTIVGNTASNNVGWGIGLAPAANGNTIISNTARGNQAGGACSGIGDFEGRSAGVPGSSSTWNDNNPVPHRGRGGATHSV